MNKENLLKLADYLEKVPSDKFEMLHFRRNEGGDSIPYISKSDCGTVGCAVGWAPFVKGLEPIKTDFLTTARLSFYKYGHRVFRLLGSSDRWDWCFHPGWSPIDNSPKGAAARIRYLVNNGLPKDWKEQMEGKASLCYKG